ncbi:DUF6957 family protein [Marinimicrobium sp. C2-29]|uniref:DUF6957 family protein n=1 Tax=Marinimicrobium sp. C2-29 TaxID=3139825 RepID=UPI00313923D9
MDARQQIAQTSRLVNGKGDSCDFGCSEEEIEVMLACSKEHFPGKPYCVVKDWCWADVDIDKRQQEEFRAKGVIPSFVYANNIIDDQAGRWSNGLSVRTTLLVEFHKNCIFLTRNTAYVLVGRGSRLTVEPAVYNNLIF